MKIEKGDYLVSDVYQGSYSSLEPSHGSLFPRYENRPTVSQLGIATDPRVANVLKEVSDKIAPGAKAVELSFIQQEILETVPKQHLQEVKRLSDLTGVDITMHAPLVEASGLTERSGFSDLNREIAERQMSTAMEKAHEVSPDKGTPVTFHSAAILPSPEIRKFQDEKTGEWKEEVEKMLVIEQESGQIVSAKKEEKYYPKYPGQKIPFPVEDQVDSMNNTQWSDSLSKLVAPKERVDRIIADEYALAQPVVNQVMTHGEENLHNLKPAQINSYLRFQNASQELDDVQIHLNSLYNKAYKYGSEEHKRTLDKMGQAFAEAIQIKNPETGQSMPNPDLKVQSAALQGLMHNLSKLPPPELFKPLNDFAFDKSAKTFGNVAYTSYKEHGDKAPIVSIENPPTSIAGFSRGEDLKKLVEASRERFIENAVKDGTAKNKAQEQAEKMIGVTWDVGHINQLRRFGFSKEDVVKETETVAPYLKHIHLSDNFGNENVELPMGMGDVPFKEMMEKVGDKAGEVKQIVEAGNWWQHFRVSPMAETFEAMGSPIYSMKADGPYWDQSVGMQQGYFGGYGQMLPPINYETFGAGFSRLPMELGGQRQGAGGSRMSGTPME